MTKFLVFAIIIIAVCCGIRFGIEITEQVEIKRHNAKMEELQENHYRVLEEIMASGVSGRQSNALPEGFMEKRNDEPI